MDAIQGFLLPEKASVTLSNAQSFLTPSLWYLLLQQEFLEGFGMTSSLVIEFENSLQAAHHCLYSGFGSISPISNFRGSYSAIKI